MTLCLHAAAAKPSYTFKEELPEDAITQAVEEGKEQAKDKFKDNMPEKAREKAMAGIVAKAKEKLQKRDVLMEQDIAVFEEPVTVETYLK
jgi:translation elongation factor EF-Ts